MANRLTAKLRSQRGASLSVALLLFLVCAVLSAVILAAATSTTGQFAERGKADQRYYAVTSAVELFTGSLNGAVPEGFSTGDDRTLTFEIVQTKTTVTPSGSSTATLEGEPTVTFKQPSSSAYFDFLPQATLYAFTGKANGTTDDIKAAITANALVEPFTQGDWVDPLVTADKKGRFGYTVAPTIPSMPGVSLPANDVVKVNVDGKLNQGDWTFDLWFSNSNKNAAGNDVTYSTYLGLTADVRDISTTNVESAVGENDAVTQKVTETKTTTITWKVDRLAPGWGGAGA